MYELVLKMSSSMEMIHFLINNQEEVGELVKK